MSLRAIPSRCFLIECDQCGRQSAPESLPVQAEVRAAAAGWYAAENPLRHRCPACVANQSHPATAGR